MISGDPSLVGKTIEVPVLLSDDADQYLKGYQTGRTDAAPGRWRSHGRRSMATTYQVQSSGDDFAKAYAEVRDFLDRAPGR